MKKKNKPRNGLVILMIVRCKAGKMKNKKNKRKNGKNKQAEYLNEEY